MSWPSKETGACSWVPGLGFKEWYSTSCHMYYEIASAVTTPGMGNGWRAQHELVMFAHRTKPAWDNHKGYGNVIEATRSGNELHPTQKPVEILEKLLDNTQWAEGVLDTFGGSGTTLIAAESVGQPAYVMEMEPAFVDVIVKRYIKTTGKTTGIRLFRKGKELGREHFERMFTE